MIGKLQEGVLGEVRARRTGYGPGVGPARSWGVSPEGSGESSHGCRTRGGKMRLLFSRYLLFQRK